MPAPETYSAHNLADFIGHNFGKSAPVVVDQSRINGFAEVTGDDQWIHVDVDRAKTQSPFGTTIAHGFLTLSLLASLVATAGVVPADAKAVLNYGVERVRFLAPVPSGATVEASFKLVGAEHKGDGRTLIRLEASLAVVGSDKPAVIAELLAMVMA